MKTLIGVTLILLTSSFAFAELQTQEVNYRVDRVNFKGYLAYDTDFQGKRPGVLVVHEWWGHNDYVRRRAEMLAKLGYTALAVDMYGDGKLAQHPDDAKKFVQEVMAQEGVSQKRFRAALNFLRKQPTVDRKNIAAIGYCFGGSTVLNMARLGIDLKGVASFHGSLATQTSAKKGKVKARVLVCHGADDSFIPPEDIDSFKKEMTNAGADFQFISYEGAKHSFTNPDADTFAQKFGMGIAYNETADKQSWEDMQVFFKDIFASQ